MRFTHNLFLEIMAYFLANKNRGQKFSCFYVQKGGALLSKKPKFIQDQCVFEQNIGCTSQNTPLPETINDKITKIDLGKP